MAQILEKVFLEKVAEMPQEEFEISAVTNKAPLKGGRKSTTGILNLIHPILFVLCFVIDGGIKVYICMFLQC